MRINLLSTPRNVSTALMYSFAQRSDMNVIDEPFYGYFLSRTELEHPGRVEVLSTMPLELDGVLESLDEAQQKNHLFIKGMAHHMKNVELSYILGMTHIIFIREPKQLIASFAQVIPEPDMDAIGVAYQSDLKSALEELGEEVIILDSGRLLDDPVRILRALCEHIGIHWHENMLRWEAGPKTYDGVWAPHWYSNVHRSTGFAKQKTSERVLPANCLALYEEARPIYDRMLSMAIG